MGNIAMKSSSFWVQRSEEALFVFLPVGAVPGEPGAPSFNGGTEMPQVRGQGSSEWRNDRTPVDLIDDFDFVDRYRFDHPEREIQS